MDRDDRMNDNLPADDPAGASPFDDAVGAYLLDALDEAELAEFEAFLRDDADAQAEAATLRPVVDLLPLAVADERMPQPSAGLRSRILQAAREDAGSTTPGNGAGGTPAAEPPRRQLEPGPAPIPQRPATPGGTILPFVRRIGFERLVAGLLALIAAGAIIWGITLQNRLNDAEDELAFYQDGEGVVQVVAYTLDPTEDGPETANGTLSMQTEESTEANLAANGMPPTEPGRVYQLWFLTLNDAGGVEGSPRPSVTFQVGADGMVDVRNVPVDGPFEAVAITNEPEGGSPAPTTPVILYGVRGVASG